MFDIDKNGNITINRGDTGHAELFINQGSEQSPLLYVLVPTDEVKLYVYQRGTKYEDAILIKTYTSANLTEDNLVAIDFLESDTKSIRPGSYLYRVKVFTEYDSVQQIFNSVNTIINETDFKIES